MKDQDDMTRNTYKGGSALLLASMLTGLLTGALSGCSESEKSTANAPETATPSAQASPGGAPTFGTSSGMGFATGDAAHNDAAGSGLMGYNHTGEAGTSYAITDTHPVSKPSVPATEPVLPPP